MKIFKLTAIFFLLFSGVFGVTAFHHRLILRADSKLIGYAAGNLSTVQNSATFLNKTVLPLDDNNILADDSLDDDDDAGFSPREKVPSETHFYTDYTPYRSGLQASSHELPGKFYHHSFYYSSHRNFISLRVFRL